MKGVVSQLQLSKSEAVPGDCDQLFPVPEAVSEGRFLQLAVGIDSHIDVNVIWYVQGQKSTFGSGAA